MTQQHIIQQKVERMRRIAKVLKQTAKECRQIGTPSALSLAEKYDSIADLALYHAEQYKKEVGSKISTRKPSLEK